MTIRIVRTLALASAAVALVHPGARAAIASRSPAIEERALAYLNQARASGGLGPAIMHAGLRAAARRHSSDMAASRSLSHDGFEKRIETSAPDPFEPAAPDDGFDVPWIAACENALYTYRSGTDSRTDDELARDIANLWLNSPPHRDCVFDVWGAGLNAAGLGVYRDASGAWWATLEFVRDGSPPGGGPHPCDVTSLAGVWIC